MGRVVAVDVKPGEEVVQGQQILTVETMKMNTFILAPKAGKVSEVLVAVGDAVVEGQLLARIA
jgi:biotin carboxyl carrier protein